MDIARIPIKHVQRIPSEFPWSGKRRSRSCDCYRLNGAATLGSRWWRDGYVCKQRNLCKRGNNPQRYTWKTTSPRQTTVEKWRGLDKITRRERRIRNRIEKFGIKACMILVLNIIGKVSKKLDRFCVYSTFLRVRRMKWMKWNIGMIGLILRSNLVLRMEGNYTFFINANFFIFQFPIERGIGYSCGSSLCFRILFITSISVKHQV